MANVIATKPCPNCRATLPASTSICLCGYKFTVGQPAQAQRPSTGQTQTFAAIQAAQVNQFQQPVGIPYVVPDWMVGYLPRGLKPLNYALVGSAGVLWVLGLMVTISFASVGKDIGGGGLSNISLIGLLLGATAWAIGLLCIAAAGALWMLSAMMERLRRLG